MRILIQGPNFSPELIGSGKYTGEMAAWLAKNGHQVHVITTPPHYPAWRIANGYRRFWFTRENYENLTILRCPTYVPSRPTGLRRVLYIVSFGLVSGIAVLWDALRLRPALFINIVPTLAAAPSCLAASKVVGGRSWLHVQDLEVDAAFSTGLVKGRWKKKVALSVERFLLRRFNIVSTISRSMIVALANKGISETDIVLFPNWVDVDEIYPLANRTAPRSDFNLPEEVFIALYAGNLSAKQGLEMFVELSAAMADEKEFMLVIAGDGPMRKFLTTALINVENVRFLPLQPAEKLNALLNCADVHLLPQKPEVANLVLPSKLAGQLASGRPIVAVAEPGSDLAQAVDGCGVVVDRSDGHEMAEAIQGLMSSPEAYRQMAINARNRAVEKWGKEATLSAFAAKLQVVIKDAKHQGDQR